MPRNRSADDSGPPPRALSDPGDPTPLAEAIAGLLKFGIVYQADHPRVRERAATLTAQLASWTGPSPWLTVRVRDQELWVGSRDCKTTSPLVVWLTGRLREAGLAGIQFAAKVEVAAAIEFAKALGSCNIRCGRAFTALWPPDHPSIRPLDLVFKGVHCDQGQASDTSPPAGDRPDAPTTVIHHATSGSHQEASTGNASGGTAQSAAEWQGDLVARLCKSAAVAAQLESIEAACVHQLNRTMSDAAASVDVLTLVVQQLPVEVLGDETRVEEVVTKALGAVQRDLNSLMQKDAEVMDADLTRRAMSVARRYFGKEVSDIEIAKNLPTGRPEDERITADLDALLQELGRLPNRKVLLPSSASLTAVAPDMAVELGGIYLNLLLAGQRSETRTMLRQNLPKVVAALGPGRLQVFDEYLQPVRQGRARTSDAERLSLLGVLADAGHGELIVERGYCDAQFLARTYPACLPALAVALAANPRGLAMLRQVLAAVPSERIGEGAQVLRQLGSLHEPKLVTAIVAIGGRGAMPLLRRTLDAPNTALRALIVEHLRSLRLPDAEAAALRCVESPAELPVRYLEDLCHMVEQDLREHTVARQHSGQVLRAMLVERWALLTPERRLLAIAGLRHLPDPENAALLRRLAQSGRFSQFGKEARAMRKQAREALQRMAAKGSQS